MIYQNSFQNWIFDLDNTMYDINLGLFKKISNRNRLSVFKSNQHIYAQLIDDEKHLTLICASSAEKKLRDMKLSPKETAFKVGEVMGDRISEKKINKKISFDRGPYL